MVIIAAHFHQYLLIKRVNQKSEIIIFLVPCYSVVSRSQTHTRERGSGNLQYTDLCCWNAIIGRLRDVTFGFILRGARLPITLIGARCLMTLRNYCNHAWLWQRRKAAIWLVPPPYIGGRHKSMYCKLPDPLSLVWVWLCQTKLFQCKQAPCIVVWAIMPSLYKLWEMSRKS